MAAPTLQQFATTFSTTLLMGQNMTAGSFIVLGIATGGGSAFQSLTSQAGLTYNQLENDGNGFILFTAVNTAGAVAERVTIAATGSSTFMVWCEIVGQYVPNPIDTHAGLGGYASPATFERNEY